MLKTGNDYPVAFLEKLYEHKVRTVHTKLELLSWDEQVLGELQGVTESGSCNIDGSSSARRSLNLSMNVIDREGDLVFDYLTPDKKVRLYIGLDNTTGEREEEDIIWFNMGIYLLTDPSYMHSTESLSVSLSAVDKMSMMNGVIGGALQTPVSFSERVGEDLVSLSWRDIFMQSAVLFGGEDPSKVVIDSVPDYIKEYVQVKTIGGQGDTYIHIDGKLPTGKTEDDVERIITRAWHPTTPEKEIKFMMGQNLYKLNRFGPQDPTSSNTENVQAYTKNTGEPVANIFEDIRTALSSTHEYYYNVNGDLIFAPIQNFINTTFDPDVDTNLGYSSYELEDEYYIPDYSNLPYTYDFSNKTTIDQITNSPDWTNVKNDFVVTGKNGQQIEIAIDHKPTIRETKEWFIKIAAEYNKDSKEMDFIAKDGVRREPYNPITNSVIFEYREGVGRRDPVYIEVPLDRVPWQIAHGLKNYYIRNIYSGQGQERMLPRWGRECESMIFKWVPSINREMLLPNTGIFDPSKVDIKEPWLNGYPIAQSANTEDDVEELDRENPTFSTTGDSRFWPYFLDIIDTDSVLGRYSIERIGKRSIAEVSENASTLFRTSPTELVVVTERELASLGGDMILEDLKKNGQAYAVVSDTNNQKFMPPVLLDKEMKNKSPYAFIHGNPVENEDMYLVYDGGKQRFTVGGKSDITFSPNVDTNNVEKPGGVTISMGEFMHPLSKKVLFHRQDVFLTSPVSTGEDGTEFGFAVAIGDKSKLQNSGKHPFIVLAKTKGEKWFYAEQKDPNKPTWVEFSFDNKKDSIIAGFNQIVTHNSGEEDLYEGSFESMYDLFNIREMKNVGLFSIGGGIDCFSSIRNLLYQHTNYAEVVTMSLLPMYNLEPNTLIRIEDELVNVSGTFMITSMSIPLETDGNSRMSINAIRVPERI